MNGVKIVETVSLLCWDQNGENRYRWTYTITYDCIEEYDTDPGDPDYACNMRTD